MNPVTDLDTTTTDEAAPRGSRRRQRLWLLLLPVLTLGLIGTAVGTSGVAHAEGRAEAGAPSRASGSTIDGKIRVKGADLDGKSLKLGMFTNADGPLPWSIGSGQSASYCYTSGWGRAAEVEATYSVRNTRYEVWVHLYVPAAGPNVLEAQLIDTRTNLPVRHSEDYVRVTSTSSWDGYQVQPLVEINGLPY